MVSPFTRSNQISSPQRCLSLFLQASFEKPTFKNKHPPSTSTTPSHGSFVSLRSLLPPCATLPHTLNPILTTFPATTLRAPIDSIPPFRTLFQLSQHKLGIIIGRRSATVTQPGWPHKMYTHTTNKVLKCNCSCGTFVMLGASCGLEITFGVCRLHEYCAPAHLCQPLTLISLGFGPRHFLYGCDSCTLIQTIHFKQTDVSGCWTACMYEGAGGSTVTQLDKAHSYACMCTVAQRRSTYLYSIPCPIVYSDGLSRVCIPGIACCKGTLSIHAFNNMGARVNCVLGTLLLQAPQQCQKQMQRPT